MKKVIVLVLSLFLIGSIYYIYDNLNNKENTIIEEDKLEEEFISYTLNGNTTELSYEDLTSDYMINSITCENGSVAKWNETDKSIKLSSINVPDYCVIDFKEKLPTLAEAILRDNPTISERTDTKIVNTANTTGTIYKTSKTEDGSTVYYYSGNTTNNWVYFGNFYWRIIRTNEDGSVRLLYAGTSHSSTEMYVAQTSFNSESNKLMYAGYMYGTNTSLDTNRSNTTDSTIKEVLDTWYQNNLLTNYDKYISKSAIYCNDRSIGSGNWSTDMKSTFYYESYYRLYEGYAHYATYVCGATGADSGTVLSTTASIADKFSASTTGGGNGQLTYPIALMTADEISFGGATYQISSSYPYFVTNSSGVLGDSFWTLSPIYGTQVISYFGTKEEKTPTVFMVVMQISSGATSMIHVKANSFVYYVRPVISISSCAKVTGTGTPTDPYIIDEANSTC